MTTFPGAATIAVKITETVSAAYVRPGSISVSEREYRALSTVLSSRPDNSDGAEMPHPSEHVVPPPNGTEDRVS